MSWPGRREGLPTRTVLMPAERRPRPRRPRLRRAAIVLVAVLVLVPVGAVIFQTVHGRGTTPVVEQRTLPSPQAPRPPAPRPVSAAFVIARQRERAITRLEGLAIPVFCGASHGREVALTFDDGPGPYTARILAILRRHHAQATFFLVGNRIRYWPRLPAAEATIGAVGDHTWSHADLGRLPRKTANGEIDRARSSDRLGREHGRPPLPHAVRPQPHLARARPRCARNARDPLERRQRRLRARDHRDRDRAARRARPAPRRDRAHARPPRRDSEGPAAAAGAPAGKAPAPGHGARVAPHRPTFATGSSGRTTAAAAVSTWRPRGLSSRTGSDPPLADKGPDPGPFRVQPASVRSRPATASASRAGLPSCRPWTASAPQRKSDRRRARASLSSVAG